jgi:alanine racemase
MHRLGFEKKDLNLLVTNISGKSNLKIISIFSHLAGAENYSLDNLTTKQINEFNDICTKFEEKAKLKPLKHLSNTAGIERFPEATMNMVRLGIGLYGISPSQNKTKLLPVSSFKSYISQIRYIPAGEGVGYGHLEKADHPRKIAVIAVGYADGYSRAFSCGVGTMLINGQPAKIVGNVCMDMTMCDVTEISCKEKDEVIIFGDHPTVEDLSKQINSIPYEILTNISERVNRIFFQE